MESKLKVLIVTQARLGSSRFKRKILQKVKGKTLLGIHLESISDCKYADGVLVATTHEEGISEVLEIVKNHNIEYYQGSVDNVLDRFYKAVLPYSPKYVVRLTSDCPLIDSKLIDEVILAALQSDVDYCTNTLIENFPDGQDVEVIKFSALESAWKMATKKFEKEHVTPFIRNNCDFNGGDLFTSINVYSKENYNHIRMTVDQVEDLNTVSWLVDELGFNRSWLDYTNHMIANQQSLQNNNIVRNEGYLKSLNNEK